MKLYILRHGPAGDQKRWAPKADHLRPLTKSGKHEVKSVAKAMRKWDLSFDVILSSPYERARRTAKIVAKVLKQKKKLLETKTLMPGGNTRALMQTLAKNQKKWEDVLLVGHEPDLSQLVSFLTTGTHQYPPDLKKTGFVQLDVIKPQFGRCATLQSLIPPRFIR